MAEEENAEKKEPDEEDDEKKRVKRRRRRRGGQIPEIIRKRASARWKRHDDHIKDKTFSRKIYKKLSQLNPLRQKQLSTALQKKLQKATKKLRLMHLKHNPLKGVKISSSLAHRPFGVKPHTLFSPPTPTPSTQINLRGRTGKVGIGDLYLKTPHQTLMNQVTAERMAREQREEGNIVVPTNEGDVLGYGSEGETSPPSYAQAYLLRQQAKHENRKRHQAILNSQVHTAKDMRSGYGVRECEFRDRCVEMGHTSGNCCPDDNGEFLNCCSNVQHGGDPDDPGPGEMVVPQSSTGVAPAGPQNANSASVNGNKALASMKAQAQFDKTVPHVPTSGTGTSAAASVGGGRRKKRTKRRRRRRKL